MDVGLYADLSILFELPIMAARCQDSDGSCYLYLWIEYQLYHDHAGHLRYRSNMFCRFQFIYDPPSIGI